MDFLRSIDRKSAITKGVALASLLLLFVFSSYADNYAPLKDSSVNLPSVAAKGLSVEMSTSVKPSLYTGAATYSYGLQLLPGTNGFSPQLYLNYSSSGTSGHAGVFGLGWNISENYIARDVEDTPDDTADDTFELVLNGERHKLVLCTDGKYRTERDNYFKIERLSDSTKNGKGEYWQVTDTGGTLYRFGYEGNSEHVASYSFNRNYVWRWSLDEATDPNGNKIYYYWVEDYTSSEMNSVRPGHIRYNTNEKRLIEFTNEQSDRADTEVYYEQGVKKRICRRISSIRIWVGGSYKGEYKLDYTESPASGKSLLTSITHKRAGATTLPPTTFEYQPMVKNINGNTDWSKTVPGPSGYMVEVDRASGNRTGVYDRGYRFGDVDGNGRIDFVIAGGGGREVWLNGGSSFSKSGTWQLPDIWFTTCDTDKPGSTDRGARLVDINGDCCADILVGCAYKGSSNSTKVVYINNGNNGWATDGGWSLPSGCEFVKLGSDVSVDLGVRFADVNGDGWVDILKGERATRVVYLHNKASGWYQSNWVLPVPFVEAYSDYGVDLGVRIADINGDGLPDLVVQSYDIESGNRYNSSYLPSSKQGVWINNGHGWGSEPNSSWSATWPNQDAGHKVYFALIGSGSTVSADQGVRLLDVNADGLADILWYRDGDGTEFYNNDQARVLINNGYAWRDKTSEWEYSGSLHVSDNQPYFVRIKTTYSGGDRWQTSYDLGHRFIDTNNDGVVDMLRGWKEINDPENLFPSSYPNRKTGRSWLQGTYADWRSDVNERPDLLIAVHHSTGSLTELDYHPSSVSPSQELPFAVWCLTAKTEDSGMSSASPHYNAFSTLYDYHNGKYDAQSSEFRGFGVSVENSRALNSLPDEEWKMAQHRFHQDDSRKGLCYQEAIWAEIHPAGGGSVVYKLSQVNDYVWTADAPIDENDDTRYKVFLTREFTMDYEKNYPNGIGARRKFTIQYPKDEYDLFGNPRKVIHSGEQNMGGMDIDTDYRYIFYTYYHDNTNHIVNRPSQKIVTNVDNSNAPISKELFSYDGNTGNLTTHRKWLNTTDSYLDTTYDYDSYGNVTRITDPRNNSTTITYENTFNTFPASVKNALDHEERYVYDPVWGQRLQKRLVSGYNGNTDIVHSYEYDAYGRLAKAIEPYDTSAYPTEKREYVDSTMPRSMKKTCKDPGNQDLVTYEFYDGFDNLIQEKGGSGAAGNWQIVTNGYFGRGSTVLRKGLPYNVSGVTSSYSTPSDTEDLTVFEYDARGRPMKTTHPDNRTNSTEYDVWEKVYTNEAGVKARFKYDAYRRLKWVKEDVGGLDYITTYAYDTLDNVVSVKDPADNTITYTFDSLGRKARMDCPDRGVWEYEYDGNDNQTGRRDPRGIYTRYHYDALNRLTRVDYPNDEDIFYWYDGGTLGTLARAEEGIGTANELQTLYTYDMRKRILRKRRIMGTGGSARQFETAWAYDSLDRATSQTYPDNGVIEYEYDKQGLLDSVSGIMEDIHYAPSGLITKKEYDNIAETRLSYDSKNLRLTEIETRPGHVIRYSYDALDNPTKIEYTRLAELRNISDEFMYDHVSRLISVEEKKEGQSAFTLTYDYNNMSNLTRINAQGEFSGAATFSYGGANGGPHALTGMDDGILPVAPTGLQAAAGGLAIDLSWKQNGDGDIDHYKLYRSLGTNTSWALLAEIKYPHATYQDSDFQHTGDRYYRLTAVDYSGSESQAGGEVLAHINIPPVLEWEGSSGYTSDGLEPETGSGSTDFVYKIKYKDAENQAPALRKVYIDKNGDGDYSDTGEVNDMTGAGADYAAGVAYSYTAAIPYSSGSQNCSYYFEFSDGVAPVATGVINKPDVSQTVSLTIDRAEWQLSNIQAGSGHITDNAKKIQVANDGDGYQTYSLELTDHSAGWAVSTDKNGADIDKFVLSGVFSESGTTGVDTSWFNEIESDDVITKGKNKATSARFGSSKASKDGASVGAGEKRNLWFEFKAPLKDSSGNAMQSITATISAEAP